MLMAINGNLQSVVAQAWNNRKSSLEYAAIIQEYQTENSPLTEEDLSTKLCDAILSQTTIGPSPSPLLLSYLKYSITAKLIRPIDFLSRLPSVMVLSRPLQITAYLEILSHLLFAVKLTDDLEFDSSETWDDQQAYAYGPIARTTAKTLLSIATLLAKIIEYNLSITESKAPQMNTNTNTAVDLLTDMINDSRLRAFLLVAREEYVELWVDLTKILTHISISRSREKLNTAVYNLLHNIHGFCSKAMIGSFQEEIQSMGMVWLALELAVELEVSGKCIFAYPDSFQMFESLRCIRGLSLGAFYSQLWVATLRVLAKSEPGTALWLRTRDFLVVKIPILISNWKAYQFSVARPPTVESTAPSVEIVSSVDIKIVEQSILTASKYASLTNKVNLIDEITGELFDPIDAILLACGIRKIVKNSVVAELFPDRHMRDPLEPPSPTEIKLEDIIAGTIPRTKADVELLKKLINPQLVLNDKNQALLDSICTSMCKKWDIQEHIVDLVFTVLDRDSHIDVGLVVHLMAHLSNTRVLDVLHTHGRMTQLVAYLAQYCDEWGMAPPEKHGISRHHHFGTAYLLLLQTLELHDLKHHPFNNAVLHNSLRSIANRNSSDFVTPVYSNVAAVALTNNQTLFPFWEWYRNYVFAVTSNSPYATREIPSGDPAHANQVSLANTLLEVLFNAPSTFSSFVCTVSPWQLLMESQGLMCRLYQACLYFGMTIERLVTALAPVAQHTPHCIAEMLHWLADELQKGFIDGDGPVAATPLPLAILAQLSEFEVPALVAETLSIRTAPILERFKPQYKIIDTLLPKYKGRRLIHRVALPPFPLPTLLQPSGTIINRIVALVLNDTFPPIISLTHILELMHNVLLRAGEAYFTTLLCKEVFDVLLQIKGPTGLPAEANVIRFAEVCGFFMGSVGAARSVSVLLTEKIPSILPLCTSAFQAKALAHLAICSLVFAGMLSSPVFVSQLEESLGLSGPFALTYLHELILFQVEQQQTLVTPSSAFSQTFLATYFTLPLTPCALIDPTITHKLVRTLRTVGHADLALALLDLKKPADRAFAAKVFGTPDLERMVTG